MAADNKKIAEDVLAAVGGKENVSSVTHCMTRLRFNLKDAGIPNEEEVKALKGVLGVVQTGGQYQIIIGQNVPKVYDEICRMGGFEAQGAIQENIDAPKEKLTPKKVGSAIMNYLSGSMTPLIPVMVAAAMFKTLMVLLGPDMLKLFTAESDAYLVFDFLYDAFYYFIPIFIGASAAKKLGINEFLGMFMGAILVVPDFVALVGAQESVWVYGLFPAAVNSYGNSLIPVLLTVAVMAPVYRFFKKVVPDALSAIFTPFLTAFVMVPLSFCILSPIGNIVGGWLGDFLLAFGNYGGFIAVALVAGAWEFVVMTGMHAPLLMFAIANLASAGCDSAIMPAGNCATWAAFGLALGAFLRLKDKEEKSLSLGYFVAGILGGVTEPALYGIGFKYKRPFIALFLGGFLGGLYAGLTHIAVYVFGATNFLSLTAYVAGGTANLVNGVIASLISMFATAAITFFFGFSKEDLAA